MKRTQERMTRLALLSVALVICAHVPASADPPNLSLADRVEEDWVLVVDDTVSADGPQLNTVMCPVGDLSQPAAVLDINYRHDPSFQPGGVQVLGYGAAGIFQSTTVSTQPLSQPNETIRWTQRMTLSGGKINYLIPATSSVTWGTSTNNTVLLSFESSVSSLGGYDPASSASNSGGAWKTQGLKSLTLVQVRYYQGNTLLWTDSTSRPVDCTKPFTRP